MTDYTLQIDRRGFLAKTVAGLAAGAALNFESLAGPKQFCSASNAKTDKDVAQALANSASLRHEATIQNILAKTAHDDAQARQRSIELAYGIGKFYEWQDKIRQAPTAEAKEELSKQAIQQIHSALCTGPEISPEFAEQLCNSMLTGKESQDQLRSVGNWTGHLFSAASLYPFSALPTGPVLGFLGMAVPQFTDRMANILESFNYSPGHVQTQLDILLRIASSTAPEPLTPNSTPPPSSNRPPLSAVEYFQLTDPFQRPEVRAKTGIVFEQSPEECARKMPERQRDAIKAVTQQSGGNTEQTSSEQAEAKLLAALKQDTKAVQQLTAEVSKLRELQAKHAEQAKKASEFNRLSSDIAGGIQIGGILLDKVFKDPKAARGFVNAATAMHQVVKLEYAFAAGMLGPIGLTAGLAYVAIGLLSKPRTSPSAALSEAVQQLSQAIARLHKDMLSNFGRVHRDNAQILKLVQEAITEIVRTRHYNRSQFIAVKRRLDQVLRGTGDAARDQYNHQLATAINEARYLVAKRKDYLDRGEAQNRHDSCLASFLTHARAASRNSVFAGKRYKSMSAAELSAEIDARPDPTLSSNLLPLLAGAVGIRDAITACPNPREWLRGTIPYLELRASFLSLGSAGTAEDLKRLWQDGHEMLATYSILAEDKSVSAAQEQYSTSVKLFTARVNSCLRQFESEHWPGMPLGPLKMAKQLWHSKMSKAESDEFARAISTTKPFHIGHTYFQGFAKLAKKHGSPNAAWRHVLSRANPVRKAMDVGLAELHSDYTPPPPIRVIDGTKPVGNLFHQGSYHCRLTFKKGPWANKATICYVNYPFGPVELTLGGHFDKKKFTLPNRNGKAIVYTVEDGASLWQLCEEGLEVYRKYLLDKALERLQSEIPTWPEFQKLEQAASLFGAMAAVRASTRVGFDADIEIQRPIAGTQDIVEHIRRIFENKRTESDIASEVVAGELFTACRRSAARLAPSSSTARKRGLDQIVDAMSHIRGLALQQGVELE